MSDVFLSYARSDKARVKGIVSRLRATGLDVWWDDDIPSAAPWEATIERALAEARVVIVCWSATAVASENVRAEARRARADDRLIQLFLDGSEPPLFFGERQGIDLSGDGSLVDAALIKLGSVLRERLGRPRPEKPSAPYIQSMDLNRRWRRPLLLAALATFLIGAAIWFALFRGGGSHPVVIVERLHAPERDEIAQTIGHNLSADLARIVVSNNATIRITDAVDTADAGRALADYVVTGDARNDGTTLHLSVRLLGNRDDGIIWSSDFARPATEAEALREQVVVRIADVVTCALGSARTPRAQLPVATLKLFLAGCELRHTDWQAASKFFRQVTEQVPTLAEPWAYYATSLAETANDAPGVDSAAIRRDARTAANRALALDPNTAEAYFALAITTPKMTDWQTKTRLVEKGLKIDPQNPELLISRFYSLLAIGRIKDAAGPAQQAVDQSPFAPLSAANLAQHLAYSGEVEAALKLLGKAHARWPREPLVEEPRFGILARVGDPAAAAALLADPAVGLDLPLIQRAGWAALIRARKDRATAPREAATIAALADRADPGARLDFVQHLAQLGDVDAAYKLALSLPKFPTPVEAVWFRNYMADFRRDPRFMTLAAKQDIAPVWLQAGIWPDFCTDDKLLRYDCRKAAPAAITASRDRL